MDYSKQKSTFQIPFDEKLQLNPFQKYQKYGRFPWKFIFHILLLTFTTIQCISIINLRTAHTRAQHQVFKYIFLQSPEESNSVPYYSLRDFQIQLNQTTQTFTNLDQYLLQSVDNSQAIYELQVYYQSFNLDQIGKQVFIIPNISEGILDPFNQSDSDSLKNFVNQISIMNLQASNILTYTDYTGGIKEPKCLNWTIQINYDFQSYSSILATITTENIYCRSKSLDSGSINYIYIHITVLCLALVSLFLSYKYIYEVAALYMKHKILYQQQHKNKPPGDSGDNNNNSNQTGIEGLEPLQRVGCNNKSVNNNQIRKSPTPLQLYEVEEQKDEQETSQLQMIQSQQLVVHNQNQVNQMVTDDEQENLNANFGQSELMNEAQQAEAKEAAKASIQSEETIEQLLNFNSSWEKISFLEKLHFFNLWFIVSIVGNFVQVFGSIVAILDVVYETPLMIFQLKESIIGFGCMFAWIIMLNYLEYNANINLMTSTLSKASANIFMFLLGVLPFFFGFVFLAQCIFWKFTKFQDTSTTIITLFSLANGDIVNDTFMEVWTEGILARFFLIIFMILFYTAVQNVFITIIMEGYEMSRLEKQNKVCKHKTLENFLNDSDYFIATEEEAEHIYKKHFSQENMQESFEGDNGEKDDKKMVLFKLQLNFQRIDKLLDELAIICQEIDQSTLKIEEKKYLITVYKENLDNLNRNIKFQLISLGKK